MVSITDVRIQIIKDEGVYNVTVISNVKIGIDEANNPIYLSFSIRWNPKTPKSLLKEKFVNLYREWKSNRVEEETIRQDLITSLK